MTLQTQAFLKMQNLKIPAILYGEKLALKTGKSQIVLQECIHPFTMLFHLSFPPFLFLKINYAIEILVARIDHLLKAESIIENA